MAAAAPFLYGHRRLCQAAILARQVGRLCRARARRARHKKPWGCCTVDVGLRASRQPDLVYAASGLGSAKSTTSWIFVQRTVGAFRPSAFSINAIIPSRSKVWSVREIFDRERPDWRARADRDCGSASLITCNSRMLLSVRTLAGPSSGEA